MSLFGAVFFEFFDDFLFHVAIHCLVAGEHGLAGHAFSTGGLAGDGEVADVRGRGSVHKFGRINGYRSCKLLTGRM
jgi:hypothetical protein